VFLRQLSCHPSSSFVVKVRYSYGAPESLNFIRMNFIKGTVVQIPIRYYNKDKNKELKRGGFLSTATRYLDVRVHGDVTYVPPFVNCNVERLSHRRCFGLADLDFDRTKFTPIAKMNSRVFASVSGKVKGLAGEVEAEAEREAAAAAATATPATTPSTPAASAASTK